MNPVEIEEAVSALAAAPFDPEEFPFAFLEAFGNKETTIKRLRSGTSNKSDLGGVLQTNNIHIAVGLPGEVTKTLAALKASPATARAKARFILATDGADFEAEDLESGETVASTYQDFPEHFGFFLPLAGITTVKQITDNAFDIRATGRLNRLYVELLKDNPEWGSAERRRDMNHFMARLIFCFFAEDTDIFNGTGLFTAAIEQMSARDSSNTHEVVGELFRAMNTKIEDRANAKVPRWADAFPYVNGGLFSGSLDVPRFSKIARSYLLHIGGLDWKRINPDIFGSMIQAVAEDEERGALGMHYTSVPNILKVLDPLFLDDLRDQLEEAGGNTRKLVNLRNRMSKIRVFDPACGSGNFLVIAYKAMRAIEAEINKRRGETGRRTEIPLTNFRGIELRDFPAEVARLALIIAEYQCDVLHRGQKEALAEFLPLDAENWIICGNALRLDWLSVCPPTGTGVKLLADDLLQTPLDQAQIDFENEGGETYICGNPPYLGSKKQTDDQKADLGALLDYRIKKWKSLDYVAGWLMKAADYGTTTKAMAAFVATNSICQGQHVPILWPEIFKTNSQIVFAHTSFRWANLASHNAGVTVVIVGISRPGRLTKRLYSVSEAETQTAACREVANINAYLVPAPNIEVEQAANPIQGMSPMQFGNHPYYGAALIFSNDKAHEIVNEAPKASRFIRPFYGSTEFIDCSPRACLWIFDEDASDAMKLRPIAERVAAVKASRIAAGNGETSANAKNRGGDKKKKEDASAKKLSETPWRFREQVMSQNQTIIVPRVSSENRPYLPVGLLEPHCVVQEKAFAMYDAPLWNIAVIASRLHWVWIGTVCVRMRTDFSYSNTLGWNTFPVPTLTEKNKTDLARCAEDILLVREAHFPATIADLYDPEKMPADLREAHEHNDEVLERIYIGRRFKNDSERLEKLFELYTKMTAGQGAARNGGAKKRKAGAGA
ncbi:DNA methyltransferase [Hyphomicrobium sp.]|uniref:class I SAM-dependent DNA methyltransferase n=1 Tax=Hyphomicrobium sp. TaxID=82 RepID=UPI000FB338AB|nr:DNA methyltransferase [Hyphomicrobium sp.]RUP10299.1 MAG: class I SAM-dependent DNA methyltransferase [Hyphomicrobium sp.]